MRDAAGSDLASSPPRRTPVWSPVLTRPLTGVIPAGSRPGVLVAIKGIHTVILASIAALIAVFVLDGIRGRPGRRAATALGVVLGEAAIYVSNNQVCPLTPLAEELGADSGSVVDIFMPDWFARRIPVVSTAVLMLGMALHVRAILMRQL